MACCSLKAQSLAVAVYSIIFGCICIIFEIAQHVQVLYVASSVTKIITFSTGGLGVLFGVLLLIGVLKDLKSLLTSWLVGFVLAFILNIAVLGFFATEFAGVYSVQSSGAHTIEKYAVKGLDLLKSYVGGSDIIDDVENGLKYFDNQMRILGAIVGVFSVHLVASIACIVTIVRYRKQRFGNPHYRLKEIVTTTDITLQPQYLTA